MKKRMCATAKRTAAIFALLVMVPAIAWAVGGFPTGGFRQEPPQEAIDACAGKKEGDAVRFRTPFGDNISGVCRDIRPKLIAVPDGGLPEPPGGRGGMGLRKGFVPMFDALDLTKEQNEQVRRIIDAEGEKVALLERQLAESREKLRQTMEAEPLDEPAVRALAAAQAKTHVEMIVSRALVERRILALLTPEQRKVAQILRKISPDIPHR